jgi:hypothetical protein
VSTQNTQAAGSLDALVSLRIRSLIADKEMVTAQANLDLARSGEWRCDYSAWHGQIDAEIEKLFDQANAAKLSHGAKEEGQ